jgi:Protein of unknown function (DUF992)
MEKSRKWPLVACAALTVAAMIAMPSASNAQPRDRTKAGTLTCDISGGIGLVVASKKDVTCMFTPATAGPREVYVGSISKFGLDVGATSGGEMVWSVFAPSNKKFGALAGEYGGASAEATVGAGLGANVLVGGSDRTVSLQPVSVQGQAGLNLAVGVAALSLRPAR